jgi:hypothetical protein
MVLQFVTQGDNQALSVVPGYAAALVATFPAPKHSDYKWRVEMCQR